MRLQGSYLGRVAAYTTQVGILTDARSVDPGEWVKSYAEYLNGVVSDVGDWVLEREGLSLRALVPSYRVEAKAKKKAAPKPVSLQLAGAMALLRGKLRAKEGTTSVRVHVPAAVFADRPGVNPKVTLMTDGLFVSGGGTPLVGTHVRFLPPSVRRSSPESDLRISDVTDAVDQGATYRGLVWVKETSQIIAAVEIVVQ